VCVCGGGGVCLCVCSSTHSWLLLYTSYRLIQNVCASAPFGGGRVIFFKEKKIKK